MGRHLTRHWRPVVTFLVAACGIAAYLKASWNYGIGTLANPGSGLFPVAIGALLLLGLAVTAVEYARTSWSVTWPPLGRSLRGVIVIGASAAYVLTLPYIGALYGTGCLVFILGLAAGVRRIWTAAATAVIVAVVFDLVFIHLLSVPLPMGPDPL